MQSERIIRTTGGEISSEARYYISSATKTAHEFNDGVRNHWGIENKLHWSLDVVMNEDDSRVWAEESGKNFSLLRKMVLNLLKKEPTQKGVLFGSAVKCLGVAGADKMCTSMGGVWSGIACNMPPPSASTTCSALGGVWMGSNCTLPSAVVAGTPPPAVASVPPPAVAVTPTPSVRVSISTWSGQNVSYSVNVANCLPEGSPVTFTKTINGTTSSSGQLGGGRGTLSSGSLVESIGGPGACGAPGHCSTTLSACCNGICDIASGTISD